jgi:hypothetical protein
VRQTIKQAYRNASFIANNRVVFNLKGNDYRLVVLVRYDRGLSLSGSSEGINSTIGLTLTRFEGASMGLKPIHTKKN